MPSFDIVSKVPWNEVDNALNQAQKELAQRYDFKDTGTEVDEEGKGGTVAVELTTTDGVVAPVDVSFSCSTG